MEQEELTHLDIGDDRQLECSTADSGGGEFTQLAESDILREHGYPTTNDALSTHAFEALLGTVDKLLGETIAERKGEGSPGSAAAVLARREVHRSSGGH
ncbi:hypothetical protein V6N12_010348 [Hibiscus sabdariffa]|uniref:Uncharacterized protein n=1 Tax=Hibiscus sabdariffa TaxID=183260 RepID=A0ABR2EM58_9ROSI